MRETHENLLSGGRSLGDMVSRVWDGGAFLFGPADGGAVAMSDYLWCKQCGRIGDIEQDLCRICQEENEDDERAEQARAELAERGQWALHKGGQHESDDL